MQWVTADIKPPKNKTVFAFDTSNNKVCVQYIYHEQVSTEGWEDTDELERVDENNFLMEGYYQILENYKGSDEYYLLTPIVRWLDESDGCNMPVKIVNEITSKIIEALKNAVNIPEEKRQKIYWESLDEDWFDYLNYKINGVE